MSAKAPGTATRSASYDTAMATVALQVTARLIAASKRAAVRACFESELKQSPQLHGTVVVDLELSPPNRASDVRVSDDDRPAFTRWVHVTMQAIRFTGLDEEVSVAYRDARITRAHPGDDEPRAWHEHPVHGDRRVLRRLAPGPDGRLEFISPQRMTSSLRAVTPKPSSTAPEGARTHR